MPLYGPAWADLRKYLAQLDGAGRLSLSEAQTPAGPGALSEVDAAPEGKRADEGEGVRGG